MATVEELIRDLESSVPGDYGMAAVRWIDNRYRELVSKVRFRHLRAVGELSIPAAVSTGTVTVSRGSATVTPNATAQAAWVISPTVATHQYWYFKASSAWYKVTSVNAAAATLTLTTAFAEDTVTAGTYELVRRHHPLASTARWIGLFWHDRMRRKLEGPIPYDVFTMRVPDRTLVSGTPTTVAQVGVDSSGVVIVELYPYPSESEIVHYSYWSLPTALTVSSTIPPQVDAYVLKEGALIDAFRWKMSQADSGEEMSLWRNESRAQETKWNQYIMDAIRADQAADDVTIMLDTMSGAAESGDIRDASGHWFATGTRP